MNLLDFLFPKSCLGCGRTGIYLCSVCLAKLEKPKLICPVCEKPQPFGETHRFCKTSNTLDGLVYFYNYQGIIRQAIHQLKYRYVTGLSIELENQILKLLDLPGNNFTLIRRRISVGRPVLIPIPLYWYKENRRGFNQASLFGKAIAKYFDIPFDDQVLIRNKPGVSQTKLSYISRKDNVEGVFSVPSNVLFPNPSVLLVDDVWTTGATIKEACRVLKVKGVKEVWGITLAR